MKNLNVCAKVFEHIIDKLPFKLELCVKTERLKTVKAVALLFSYFYVHVATRS